jgi:ADP-ribosylglycohydrolase
VVPSVLWSLYSFLRSPDDYWQTIRTAIAVGGDVDTTAAMAGAISGAHLGLTAIPRKLAGQLTDQGSWGFSDLTDLAGKCYDVQCRHPA